MGNGPEDEARRAILIDLAEMMGTGVAEDGFFRSDFKQRRDPDYLTVIPPAANFIRKDMVQQLGIVDIAYGQEGTGKTQFRLWLQNKERRKHSYPGTDRDLLVINHGLRQEQDVVDDIARDLFVQAVEESDSKPLSPEQAGKLIGLIQGLNQRTRRAFGRLITELQDPSHDTPHWGHAPSLFHLGRTMSRSLEISDERREWLREVGAGVSTKHSTSDTPKSLFKIFSVTELEKLRRSFVN